MFARRRRRALPKAWSALRYQDRRPLRPAVTDRAARWAVRVRHLRLTHGIPLPRPLRPENFRHHLRQLAHPRLAGRERRGRAMRAGRPRRRDHQLRHRRRLRQRRRRIGARRCAQGRAPRVAGDLHQGVLADRPEGAQRRRAVPQAHRGIDRPLPHPPAHRLRRPLPGSSIRHRDSARGDDAGLRPGRPAGQGAVHRGQRMDRRAASRRACAGHRPWHPTDLQPAAVLDAVAGDRAGGGADLPGAGRLADRLVAGRAGRADRQVPAGRRAAARIAGHRREGWRGHDQAVHDRRRAHPGAGAAADRRRTRPDHGATGRGLGAVATTTSPRHWSVRPVRSRCTRTSRPPG